MRFGRNLTASEILDQALHYRRLERVNHLVYMGMGEPMLNLRRGGCRLRTAPSRPRHHTPADNRLDRRLASRARRFVDEVDEPVKLAFSLHARATHCAAS